MRNQTAVNEWGLIDTHTLRLYYTCIAYLSRHTHTHDELYQPDWKKDRKKEKKKKKKPESATSVSVDLD